MAQKALKVGMELQAKYIDGAFYHAIVLDVRMTGSKPVLVHYKGHGDQADCWLPLASLKSKVLTAAGATMEKGASVGKGTGKRPPVIVESLAPPSMVWKAVQPSDPSPIISKTQSAKTMKPAAPSPQGLLWKPVSAETALVRTPAAEPSKQISAYSKTSVWKPVKHDATPQTQALKTAKPTPPPSGTQLQKKKGNIKPAPVWKPVTSDSSSPPEQKPQSQTPPLSKGRVWQVKSDSASPSAKEQSKRLGAPTSRTQARTYAKQGPQVWKAVQPVPVTRGIVQTKLGGMHYVTSGIIRSKLTPILAFHMNTRSVDEYREVMQLLSKNGRFVIAVDEFGHGASDNPNTSCTLEEIADAALAVALSLHVKSFVTCGSLLGNFLALALAKRQPQRVKAAILTHGSMCPEDKVANGKGCASDSMELTEDGTHVMNTFNNGKGRLDPEMNTRATIDALVHRLKTGERTAAGISIQDPKFFDFEAAARSTKCPVLAINSIEMSDCMFNEEFDKVRGYFGKLTVPGRIPGDVNIINTNPKEWTAEVSQFLEKHGL